MKIPIIPVDYDVYFGPGQNMSSIKVVGRLHYPKFIASENESQNLFTILVSQIKKHTPHPNIEKMYPVEIKALDTPTDDFRRGTWIHKFEIILSI